MTDYIRGRDQFLNQTQGMIDQYTEKMKTMDLANPNVSGRATQYMNYLYELRGRQNKRYVEFLNGSIGVYNAQLTDVSNNYDKALSTYESELTLKSQLKQTEYQMYYTALTGMYNSALQAPIIAKQKALLDAQTAAANAIAAKDGAGLVGKGTVDDLNSITTKTDGILTYQTKSPTGESKSLFMPSVKSLSGFINTVSGYGPIAPSSALQYGVAAMINGIDSAPDSKTAATEGSKYIGWVADLYKNAKSDADATNATLVRKSVQDSISGKIQSTLEADTGVLSSIRGSLQSIISPGFFSRAPTEQQFVASFGSVLGPEIAQSLWAGMTKFKADNGAIVLPDVSNPSALASLIANIASDGYVTNIWNTALLNTNSGTTPAPGR
jgi:hypothetical protein